MSDTDFSKAKYTAIISDLHLCDAEPIRPKYPLWKKYKTREFFYDDQIQLFLKKIQAQANYEPIELVLNGDIFDFDSITSYPLDAIYKISWLEKMRGLKPREERSLYKINKIITDHDLFFKSIKEFIESGNKVIFIFGNHDVELHFKVVQEAILKSLDLKDDLKNQIRFNEWFYISNKDTLIEHGNQYDPYCVFDDPINPFVKAYNYLYMKLPFGNLASRYIMNGMGFFNPHSDSNYIMGFLDYIKMFIKYMAKAQPFLILTWFMGAIWTLFYTIKDQFAESIRNPLATEERVNYIAFKSNATPRQVRELKELFVENANRDPFLIMKELWLDRAFLIFISFFVIFQIFSVLKNIFGISLFWGFIPLFMLVPFFMFYTKSIVSLVSGYKEPDEKILATAGYITGVSRIVFGHTHITRHEMIGSIEHLNSGTWSPGYLDIECTQPIGQKNYVWIYPNSEGSAREAKLLKHTTHRDGG
ncbi:MAG: metallophosphoesterase [Bdellovibrionaceae bacterium]|nr:metallophosphoesterase [Pseudobdellovibrionaceae bacterium]NUM57558.1 metallophosphoesterase [Pseudobdellovibrionaceae bacterium]